MRDRIINAILVPVAVAVLTGCQCSADPSDAPADNLGGGMDLNGFELSNEAVSRPDPALDDEHRQAVNAAQIGED